VPRACRRSDSDAHCVPHRRMTNAGAGLASVPIIDYRGYVDNAPWRGAPALPLIRNEEAPGKRERPVRNQVMWWKTAPRSGFIAVTARCLQRMPRRWTAGSLPSRPTPARVLRSTRSYATAGGNLLEGCMTRGANPTFIAGAQIREQGGVYTVQPALPPSNSFPREVAGADVATEIIKCHRKPLQQSDYAVRSHQRPVDTLEAIFPDGGLRLVQAWLRTAKPRRVRGLASIRKCVVEEPPLV